MNQSRVDFIKLFKEAIIIACKGTGLFPSLMMAQAILESTGKVGSEYKAGESKLAKECNNFFGIKDSPSDEWHGLSKKFITREVIHGVEQMIVDYFRHYSTPLECFKDRNNFLQQNTRYKKAGVFSAATPQDQARALQKAGYATDPKYAELLINIIVNYGLEKLDDCLNK